MSAVVELSLAEARRAALWCQGFLAPPNSPAGVRRLPADAQQRVVRQMVRDLGAVQLDTISVLARSHELVAYARFGNVGRTSIESAYWDDHSSFEYWSHAACILPIESWPLFAFRRRRYVAKGIRWHEVPKTVVSAVLDRLGSDGPLTTKDIGGAKKGGEWWDWSESKIAIEWLLDIGQVVCTSRVGWRRVYDLAERVVPQSVAAQRDWVDKGGAYGPPDEDCLRALVADAARTIGVGTSGDIADVHRLTVAEVERNAADAGLRPVTVPGWTQRTWATPTVLDWLGSGVRATHRTTLLSPFDSLVWHRKRAERLFDMAHRLEAYTPAAKRVHGYFAMPILHGGELVARVDPAREGTILVARRVTLEVDRAGRVPNSALVGTARGLREAATWVASTSIRVDEVRPSSATADLTRMVAENH